LNKREVIRMSRHFSLLVLILFCTPLFCIGCSPQGVPRTATTGHNTADTSGVAIIVPSDATNVERLAAQEVRRYVYLRTGSLLPLVQSSGKLPAKPALIVVGQKDRPAVTALTAGDRNLASSAASLKPQQYVLKTTNSGNQQILLITGGDPVGTLYGAYRFAEHLGVRFYLHGDTIPDERITLKLPDLNEKGAPLFSVRGIQPFHDFPEGPDWWNADDYKAVIAQLPKLRMNFIGLHTYPQGGVGPEPTVWIGLPGDFNRDGTVNFAYPARHFTTANVTGAWGYKPTKTGDYVLGASQLFERDDYGANYMVGMNPWTQLSNKKACELFDRMGRTLRAAFEYAHALGVKTCVGTETPLVIPDAVKKRLKSMGKDPSDPAVVRELYEGVFQRISEAYPLDYYWFWTPEGWTWGNPKDQQVQATLADFRAAIAAAKKVRAPFTLATCGWVLGPPKDRALFDKSLPKNMPMSCINRNVGFSPVEPGFARVHGRPKWAIPWLEDDPGLTVPQLWAGRMRRDAADALAYGCTGLLGIHWRTRILGPNVSALAHAAWDQKGWNPDFGGKIEPPRAKLSEGREGGNVAQFPNNAIADTENDPLYQTVIWDVKAYRLKVPDGTYTVTLKFCEPHYEAAGKRVFDVSLQGRKVIENLDIFAEVGKDRALDYTFEGISVKNGLLELGFQNVVEFPCIAAFVVQGSGVTRKINCGGPAYKDFEADLPAVESDTRPRDLPVDDFYADWALTQFGPRVAKPAAELFVSLDGGPSAANGGQRRTRLPLPVTWVGGPGGIKPDDRPWEQVGKEYAFVERMAQLRPQVRGRGNLERFDYWLNSFRYLRAVGRLNCTWARFNAAMTKVKAEKEPQLRKRLARQIALPVRKELVVQAADVQRYLLATVSTNGGMGNVANWQQHIMPTLLTEPGRELAGILGEDLPADAMPSESYQGPLRVIVPTVRSSISAGEDLKLKVIILAAEPPREAVLYWRTMGKGNYRKVPLRHFARDVYSVQIPAGSIKSDLEYYIKATSADGTEALFPPAAPDITQTVVTIEAN
jgi:Malectin domain/Glycosyl hydrolase family 67 N-terminus